MDLFKGVITCHQVWVLQAIWKSLFSSVLVISKWAYLPRWTLDRPAEQPIPHYKELFLPGATEQAMCLCVCWLWDQSPLTLFSCCSACVDPMELGAASAATGLVPPHTCSPAHRGWTGLNQQVLLMYYQPLCHTSPLQTYASSLFYSPLLHTPASLFSSILDTNPLSIHSSLPLFTTLFQFSTPHYCSTLYFSPTPPPLLSSPTPPLLPHTNTTWVDYSKCLPFRTLPPAPHWWRR